MIVQMISLHQSDAQAMGAIENGLILNLTADGTAKLPHSSESCLEASLRPESVDRILASLL